MHGTICGSNPPPLLHLIFYNKYRVIGGQYTGYGNLKLAADEINVFSFFLRGFLSGAVPVANGRPCSGFYNWLFMWPLQGEMRGLCLCFGLFPLLVLPEMTPCRHLEGLNRRPESATNKKSPCVSGRGFFMSWRSG